MFNVAKSFKNTIDPKRPRRSASFMVGAAIVVAGLLFMGPPSTAKEGDLGDASLPECANKPAASRLYAQLRDRHINLRERTLSLEREAKMLEKQRTALKAQVETLRGLRAEVDERLDTWSIKDDMERRERISHLVDVLAEVPAPGAARILLELDAALAVDVLNNSDKTRAGEILAAIPPDRAARFADALANGQPRP